MKQVIGGLYIHPIFPRMGKLPLARFPESRQSYAHKILMDSGPETEQKIQLTCWFCKFKTIWRDLKSHETLRFHNQLTPKQYLYPYEMKGKYQIEIGSHLTGLKLLANSCTRHLLPLSAINQNTSLSWLKRFRHPTTEISKKLWVLLLSIKSPTQFSSKRPLTCIVYAGWMPVMAWWRFWLLPLLHPSCFYLFLFFFWNKNYSKIH